MKRLLLLLSVYLGWACSAPPSASSPTRPNILIIVSDDHGTDDLGCYGNTAIKTPNLDDLASQGVRFTQAYCTSASCSASRSTILSGAYNHANGHYGHMHHFHHFSAYDHVQTLPVLLEELGGYRTARIGKYHLAPEHVFRFQEALPGDARNAVEMAHNSKDFIASSSDKPFFLYYCTSDPHRSGDDKLDPKLPPNRFGNKDEGYPGVKTVRFSPDSVIVPDYLPDTRQAREELAEYYQSVSRLDQGVGTLMQHLKDAGKWDNTVIVYISDNGIAFAGAKTTIYQPGINLPCIVKYTDQQQAGKVSDAMINWVDLTPTLLDVAGLLPEAQARLQAVYEEKSKHWGNTSYVDFQGKSFKDVFEKGESEGRNETYASHTFHEITMYYPMRSIITRDFKLIWNVAYQLPYPHSTDLWASSTWQSVLKSEEQQYGLRTIDEYLHRPEFELYDLSKDPYESRNLASDPKYAQLMERLKLKIKQFQKKTQDPWLAKWEHQ